MTSVLLAEPLPDLELHDGYRDRVQVVGRIQVRMLAVQQEQRIVGQFLGIRFACI